MRVEKRTGSVNRQVLIGIITNKSVCGAVASKWDGELFGSRHENLLAGWAVSHYRKYNKAPKRAIETYFDNWSARGQDKDTVELIEKFLAGLSDEYARSRDDISSEMLKDLASDLFKKVGVQKLKDELQGLLEIGDVDKAWKIINQARPIDIGHGAVVDLLAGGEEIISAFEDVGDVLIRWDTEALANFFSTTLARGEFFAFMSPEKRGKCLDGDTEVVLASGRVRTVQEIYESKDKTPLLSMNTETRMLEKIPASEFYDNGIKECWEVVTKSGRSIKITKNHKFYTPEGWKKLSQIGVGDYIATPRQIPVFGRKSLPEHEIKFLAYMLAEGCCVKTYNKGKPWGYATSFTNADPVMVRDFEDCCARMGFTYRRTGIATHLHNQCRPMLRKYGILGCSAKTKIIPPEIFTLPKNQLATFLRIFFSCDGWVTTNEGGSLTIGMTLANEKMTRQISHLLIRFGILHKFSPKKAKCSGKTFDAWHVSIRSQEHVNIFLREINMISYKRTLQSCTDLPSKSFLDKLPAIDAKSLYMELEKAAERIYVPANTGSGKGKYTRPGYALREMLGGRRPTGAIRGQIAAGEPLMKQSFIRVKKTEEFKKYFESDLMWEEIVSIKSAGLRQTYDLAVPKNHNFVAGDCIVHNSFWLQELAWQAMLQENKVAFFEVGDQTKKQIIRRFGARAARRPFKMNTKVRIPVSVEQGTEPPEFNYEEFSYDRPISGEEADAALRDFGVHFDSDSIKLSVHPNSSISVAGIENILADWKRDGWIPDVICIDYADILAPLPGYTESRDAINAAWKAMRSLGQKLDCLVATATQSDAASYEVELLRRSNFSEDKRKYSHVTALVCVNQTEAEKERQVQRLNMLMGRDLEFSEERVVYCCGCLAVANPAILSIY